MTIFFSFLISLSKIYQFRIFRYAFRYVKFFNFVFEKLCRNILCTQILCQTAWFNFFLKIQFPKAKKGWQSSRFAKPRFLRNENIGDAHFVSNGIVSTLLSILRASSQVLFSFSTSQKLRMTKRLQKSLLCNHNILVMFWRLVSKMKRGSRKRRQELHCVRETSCQSPIRTGLSFGHFSGNHRLVDLPEYWGFFLEISLEFWENSWVFGKCLGKNWQLRLKMSKN